MGEMILSGIKIKIKDLQAVQIDVWTTHQDLSLHGNELKGVNHAWLGV